MKKVFKNMMVVFGVLTAVSVIPVGNKGGNPGINSAEAQTQGSVIKVTPDQLQQDYKDNAIAADQKYKNKNLELKATVASLISGNDDKPYIRLKVNGEMDPLLPRAYLANSEIDKAATLKKGQEITVLCKGNGTLSDLPIMLADCVIK